MSGQAVEATEPQVTEPSGEEAQDVDAGEIVGTLFPGFAEDSEAPSPKKNGKAASKTVQAEEAEEDGEETTEAEETEGPEAEEEGAKDPFSLLRLDDLFSDKALASKQGIAAARDVVLRGRKAAREMHQVAHDMHLRAKNHEDGARRAKAEAHRAMRAAQALEARVQADIDTAFNSGDAEAVATALGRLSKRDANKLYEQWTEIQIGKKRAEGQKDPRLDAVLDEIKGLKSEKERERTEQQERAIAEKRVAWLQSLDRDVQAGKDTHYPTLAHYLTLEGKPAEVARYVDELARGHHKETGEWPSNAALLKHVENELKPLVRVPKKTVATAQQRNGRLPGRSVSPSLGAQRSHPKGLDDMTQEEREEKMNEDADEILSGLGIQL